MALYHILTFKSGDHPSLVSNFDLEDDLSAVAQAKQLLRKGETLDVWRGEKLVYRMGLGTASFERLRYTQPTRVEIGCKSNPVQRVATIFRQKWSVFGTDL
jgi:hypothetical protein